MKPISKAELDALEARIDDASTHSDMPRLIEVVRLIETVRHLHDRIAAYATQLETAIDLLNEDHRHSRAAGEDILSALLDDMRED